LRNLDIVGIIVGEGGGSGSGEFLFDGLHQLGVDLHFGRLESGGSDELEAVVAVRVFGQSDESNPGREP
jgi:hypothetical protein